MKILENRYIEKSSKIVICPNCASKLEIEANDIQQDKDGTYIICPCCHKYIDEKALIVLKNEK